jgi:Holliday junction resolvasome RuvABC endonuclease subunit
MGLVDILKKETKAINTVLGVDASTNSFAFALFDKNGPVKWGEIKFSGETALQRLSKGQKYIEALKKELKPDLVCFEGAIYVQNKRTVILMAYAIGALVAPIIGDGAVAEELSPIEWQRAIGNKPLSKEEKEVIRKAFPDQSESWYKNKQRLVRKDKTIQWVEDTYGIKVESDNVGDAIALGSVAFDKYGTP